MGASQLIIIDVQNGFINEWTSHVPQRVEMLQDSFDRIIVTRLYNPRGSPFRKLLRWDEFSLGSSATNLAFEPREDATILDKPSYSFATDEFIKDLSNDGIQRIHICGLSTDSAVLKCSVDLFEAGVEPVVLAYACGSFQGPAAHEAGIMVLRNLIGERQVSGS
jgi:nicotinamidase-related amidase